MGEDEVDVKTPNPGGCRAVTKTIGIEPIPEKKKICVLILQPDRLEFLPEFLPEWPGWLKNVNTPKILEESAQE